MRVLAGDLERLESEGRLLAKVGAHPVVVFWHDHRPWAIEDRCPHMGFPLRQGTVEAGMVTCHWHHARFDLESGCTLDPFADDARAYDAAIEDGQVWVSERPDGDVVGRLERRLRTGLEDGLTLVIAKSVLGLIEAEVPAHTIVGAGADFGATVRGPGWGSGLTVLVAMANLLPHLHPDDRPLALTHGLAFVSRDSRGHPPRFPLDPLDTHEIPSERLARWYRRFIETRSPDAAERALATAVRARPPAAVEEMMFAAVTDHVFIDEGHTIDFTNKAFEGIDLLGPDSAHRLLPTLVTQTAAAQRSEEMSAWRHPHDLRTLAAATIGELPAAMAEGAARADRYPDGAVAELGWALLADEPEDVTAALLAAARAGASPEQLGRAVAFAAALRITRFHTQNDFGDWNTVHHAFTTANAVHQALARRPTPEMMRGVVHGALRVFLDRFLNVPAARLPSARSGDLAELQECWDGQGHVDRAGNVVYGHLRAGGDPAAAVAALGGALLAEDAGFHWYQVVEAGVRQARTWPDGSEEQALVLAGVARFLAAHTPTRRELPTVFRIAARLRRGEHLYEELAEDGPTPA